MELFVSRMKGRKRQIVDIIGLFICLIPSTIFLWGTAKAGIRSLTESQFQMGIFNFPLWPSKLALPVGFLLLALCLIAQIWERLQMIEGLNGEESDGEIDQ